MSRVTFKFPEEMVEKHRPRKEASSLSWPEYFDGQAPSYEPLSAEEVRQIVREECGESEPDGSEHSNEDLYLQIQALREQIDELSGNGSRY